LFFISGAFRSAFKFLERFALQEPDQGNTSVVYGSHKQLNGPDSLGDWRGGSSGGATGTRDARDMPNHEQFVGSAGDALLFDIRTYHAAFPNLTQDKNRCGNPKPFWALVKNHLINTLTKNIVLPRQARGKH
jgi:hypothetical protein